MREIDFLPGWYPAIQRRYRAMVMQAWATLLVAMLIGGYAVAKRVQVFQARQITAQTEAQIRVSQQQLAQLTRKLKYESELREQDQIVARLGLGVETTRLLQGMEDAMTPEMALTDLSLETVEQARPTQSLIAMNRRATNDTTPDVDRRLKVVVSGVAPTDTDSATFVEQLLKMKVFDNVALAYMHEGRSRDGHVTREFQVTFEMNLNPPSEGK